MYVEDEVRSYICYFSYDSRCGLTDSNFDSSSKKMESPLADKQMLHGDLLHKWLLPRFPLLLLLRVKISYTRKFVKTKRKKPGAPTYVLTWVFPGGGEVPSRLVAKGGTISFHGRWLKLPAQSTSPAHRIRTNSASRVALISELLSSWEAAYILHHFESYVCLSLRA